MADGKGVPNSNYFPAGVAPHKLGLNPLELEFRAENTLVEVKPLVTIPKIRCIDVHFYLFIAPYDLYTDRSYYAGHIRTTCPAKSWLLAALDRHHAQEVK